MSISTIQPQWHVVYTSARAEKQVATRIEKMGFEVFLPLQIVRRRWSDRIKSVEVPLFANYVFVKVDRINRYSLMSIKGVVSFVTMEKAPAIVRQKEIDSIRKLLEFNTPIEEEEYFIKGMSVRIEEGPFEGLEGVILKKGADTRLVVKVEQLEKALSINVAPDMLRLLHINCNTNVGMTINPSYHYM